MGKLRPRRRQGLTQGHPASQQHGNLCAPAPTIPPRPGTLLRLAGNGDPGIPALPGPSLAVPGSAEPRVAGWARGHSGGAGHEGSDGLTFPDRPAHSCWGATGPPTPPHPAPPHTVPIVCPRHFELPLPLASNTAPHPPVAGGGRAPQAKAHLSQPPAPQRATTPALREPSNDQRGKVTRPSHPGQNPNPWTPTPMHFSSLRTPLPNPSTQGAAGHPSSQLLPRAGPGLCWPLATPAFTSPCLGVNIPILQSRKPTQEGRRLPRPPSEEQLR